ncbi:MAG: hypothetical protein WAK93_06380 [Solirubrobacteraceae bacterium]
MRELGPRVSRAEVLLLVALAAWGFFPLALQLIHAADLHARYTGADGLIGADGVLGADQLQYLAWARDASAHGLASDLFNLAPSAHVYLEPLFAITGGLYRLGVPLATAYLVWKPVAIVAMVLAAAAWARRMFGDQLAARAATVALSLFLFTPLTALFSWTGLGSGSFRFNLYLLGDELLWATKLWGYVPSALGLALVPVVLLAAERAVDPDVGAAPVRSPPWPIGAPPRVSRPRVAAGPLLVAGVAALLASLLHPWQGVTLIVIFVALAAVRRLRNALALAVPAIGAALPLAYYYLLSHHDAAWKLAAHYEAIPRLPALVLLAGFGPLAVIAALGVRRPEGVLIEQALLLWIGACFVTYFLNDSFPAHALQGLSMPFAVLAVRGGQRLRLPAVVGALVIALLTIPGLAYDARKFVRTAKSPIAQYYLPQSDAHALDWVDHDAPAGGVLAPTPFAAVVPSQTGRQVWAGHGYWTPDYPERARQVDRLFGGRMHPAAARSFVRSTGAKVLISDCKHPTDLTRPLKPLVSSVHRFGCARVYLLKRA